MFLFWSIWKYSNLCYLSETWIYNLNILLSNVLEYQVTSELKEEREMNEMLRNDQQLWKHKVNELEKKCATCEQVFSQVQFVFRSDDSCAYCLLFSIWSETDHDAFLATCDVSYYVFGTILYVFEESLGKFHIICVISRDVALHVEFLSLKLLSVSKSISCSLTYSAHFSFSILESPYFFFCNLLSPCRFVGIPEKSYHLLFNTQY